MRKSSRCNHLRDLMTSQMPAVEKAIERNRYYLGEIARHYIPKEAAETDFLTNHVQQYWGEIFKALFCIYKCPDGQICEIAQTKYHNIAGMFAREVEEFGIDEILKGEDATERIFTRYKEIVNSREV